MDACHILLCRPWQFDTRKFHDGFLNTYSFEKDGTKITLAPLRMLVAPKPSKEKGSNLLLYVKLRELYQNIGMGML
jgi:hypothetical protein